MKTNTDNWEERKKIIRYYDLRRNRNRKRTMLLMRSFWNITCRIGRAIIIISSLLGAIFISVMVGYSSEPIVYALNKSFGLGYARFASYALCALTFYLLKGTYELQEKK